MPDPREAQFRDGDPNQEGEVESGSLERGGQPMTSGSVYRDGPEAELAAALVRASEAEMALVAAKERIERLEEKMEKRRRTMSQKAFAIIASVLVVLVGTIATICLVLGSGQPALSAVGGGALTFAVLAAIGARVIACFLPE